MTRRQGDQMTGVGLRYVGGGAFLPHVPARDLTADEVTQYAVWLEEARAAGTLDGIYSPLPLPRPEGAPAPLGAGIVGGTRDEKGEVVNG